MLCTAAVCWHRCRPDIQYNRPEQSEPNTGCYKLDQPESVIDFDDAFDQQ
jgi:hypothetical protein